MKMGADKFCLKWNDYEQNMNQAFIDIREANCFLDVTLVCEDNEQMPAHKVILSACSSFFRKVLEFNPHQHPLVYLRGVKYADLQNIVDFMYHGEVNVEQEELNSFLAVAEDLKIKGLTQNLSATSPSKRKDISPPRSPLPPSSIGTRSPRTPAAKRSRRDLSTTKNNLNSDIMENSRLNVKSEPRDSSLQSTPSHHHELDIVVGADVSADVDEDESFDNSENYEGYSAGTYAPGYDPGNMDNSNVSSESNKGAVSDYFDNKQISPKSGKRGPKGKYDPDVNNLKISVNSGIQGSLLDISGNENIMGGGNESEIEDGNESNIEEGNERIIGHQNPPFHPMVDAQTCDERLDDLAREHIQRQDTGKGRELLCKICGKINKDMTKAKSHLESIHFPTEGAYKCGRCGKVKNTKKALQGHERKCL